MKEIVVDASVGAAWCFEDEQDDFSVSVLRLGNSLSFVVPRHWTLEVANALSIAHRRNRIDLAALTRYAGFLNSLHVAVDEETERHGLRTTLDLSRRFELTTYDAAYLELALRRNLPLASIDKKLNEASLNAGAVLFQP